MKRVYLTVPFAMFLLMLLSAVAAEARSCAEGCEARCIQGGQGSICVDRCVAGRNGCRGQGHRTYDDIHSGTRVKSYIKRAPKKAR
jgi:hypothetical protein